MNKNKPCIIITGILLSICFAGEVSGQQVLVNKEKKQALVNLSAKLNKQYQSAHQRAVALAKAHGWPVYRKTKNGGVMSLQGVNSLGYPEYLITTDNTIAAASTGTNTVQPGGSLGLNLSGSSPGLANKLAMWDGGSVYKAHQEFAGKTITLHDATQAIDHSTHVAGTMIARGVNPLVQGMAFNASTLHSYDFDNDIAEMSAAAPGLLLSNHSYADIAGWYFDENHSVWDWYGLPGDTVDYKFGFYGQRTQAFDQIAYNAPYYLIVQSADNSHGSTGPSVGMDYFGFNGNTQTLIDKGPRPDNISSNAGYDVIITTANAKNILTVGAVNPLPDGPANSKDISIAYFSGWGPSDDGRIKPDIVGDGVNVTSTGSSSPNDYITFSGTSMSAPNVTGSLYLLQEYYAQKHGGNFMRAATLKGLACHTAFDAGNPGPDYIYGWGLLDMKRAAQAITDNGTKSLVEENLLKQGQQQQTTVVASGDGPLAATISWTDPAGTATPDGTVNDRTAKLVNDLDIRVSDGTTTFLPWILDPSKPQAVASKGDNQLDNVEQVFIPGSVIGTTYTITVSHKGSLRSGSQAYSLIVTGIGGSPYCASSPSSNADSRITNVTLSNIKNTPPACSLNSDYTNLTGLLAQGKTYPLSVTLGTCAANADKAAKVYIDWNGDGIFESNELVATTNIINTTGTYNTNITVPPTVVPGNFSLMRVVLTETGDTSLIKACGMYASGQTQNYKVKFTIDSAKATFIFNNKASGTISACEGTASAAPYIEQFTVSAQNLKEDLTVTAPAGFEVSLSNGSGFAASLTIPPTGGKISSTIIYVRSTSSAPGGFISGNVVLSSTGITQTVAVTGAINPVPKINPVPDQGPYTSGSPTQPINFTGTGSVYNWTSDTPGIGLPASGTGNIPSFIAINDGTIPIKATITVTAEPYSFAYIANYLSSTVSVINITTQAVIAPPIPVGKSPWGVAASADGKRVYVTAQDGNTVSVIDTKTNTEITRIPVGLSPEGICVSPDGSKVYVACLSSSAVYVIDATTNTIESQIAVDQGATGICVSPDGSRVYVTCTGNALNAVWVINTANNAVLNKIKVGERPFGICLSPDGTKAYVANNNSNTVSVINLTTNTVVDIPVGIHPSAVCINAGGTKVFVTNHDTNSISVINTATNAISNEITTGGGPASLSLTPNGKQLLGTNSYDNNVGIYSTTNESLIANVATGSFPNSLGNFISKRTGCFGTPIQFIITINPAPIPTITASAATGSISTCAGGASISPNIQQFTISGSLLKGDITASAPDGFEISLSAGSGYGGTLTLAQSNSVVNNTTIYVRTAATAPSGTVSGFVLLTSAGATPQAVAVTATVNAQQGPSVSIAVLSNNICAGTQVTFTATPQNGGDAPVYQWLLNGSPAGTGGTTYVTNALVAGDMVSCKMTGNTSCAVPAGAISNSIIMNVSSLQAPSISIAASSNNVCAGTPVKFTATSTNGGAAPVYQWLLNGNPTGTNDAVFMSSTLVDGDKVSCTITSNAPCATVINATSNSITMSIKPSPTVNAGDSKTITTGSSTTLNASATGNITDITWSPAAGLSNNKILNPVASPVSTTTYKIVVQTSGGCTAVDSAKITVHSPDIIIPNTFTPNGDRINDTWNIQHLDSYTNCTVQIFTRTGQIVYSSIGYPTAWNGTYNGRPAPTGTYYYIINLKDSGKKLSGYVTIIR